MASTASITLVSDLTNDATGISTSTTLVKAGSTNTDLDQFTGVKTIIFATAQTDTVLVAAADYATGSAGVAHKVYIRNATPANISTTAFVTIDIDSSSNEPLGPLYPGDWAFFPYDGALDIDIDTSAANVTVEVAVLSQSVATT